MASIKFILRFTADNFTLFKSLFNYYKMILTFVVKIPNRKSGKINITSVSSRTGAHTGVAIPKEFRNLWGIATSCFALLAMTVLY